MKRFIKKFKILTRINKLLHARKTILKEVCCNEFGGEEQSFLLDIDTRIKKHIETLDDIYSKLQ